MRTTVDLPPAAHRRAREIAARTGASLSSVIADLTMRGLALTEQDEQLGSHPVTGFPTVSTGHPVDGEDVASLWDEE